MKKEKMISAILIAMLSVVFSMSDDGGNVPVISKKEAISESSQVVQQAEQPVKKEKSEERNNLTELNAPAKDWFGFDTGLSVKEFQEHQEAYIQQYIEFAQSVIGKVKYKNDKKEQEAKIWWRERALEAFESRLNLNTINDLKKYGIEEKDFFAGYDANGIESFAYAVVVSPIIIHGKIIEMDNKEKKYGSAVYELQPYEILKGDYYFTENPKMIKVEVWNKVHYKIGDDIIAFLGFQSGKSYNKENITVSLFHTVGVQLIISNSSAYMEYIPGSRPETRKVGTLDEVKITIKEISKIIDFNNFYKIDFRRK